MGMINKFLNYIGVQDEEEVIEREEIVDTTDEFAPNPFDKRKNKGNVVSIHSQKNTRIVLNEPRSYEEAQDIADHLRARRPVVVNLQKVSSEHALRIVDFLSGTVYALNGTISKIGSRIFLCTPETVEIQGSISDLRNDREESN